MEVEIKFEPSGREGIVPVGTYLADAAARLGVEIVDELDGKSEYEADVVRVTKGAELLSEPTKIEIEHLSSQKREKGERLAGQTRIEKAGEIVVMVAKKKETETEKQEKEVRDFKKEFSELPLEKKVANLLEMEMVTLSETASFVFNSPFKLFEMGMNVLAEFGLKLEQDAKNAKRPDEHKTEEKAEDKTENAASENGSAEETSSAKTESAETEKNEK